MRMFSFRMSEHSAETDNDRYRSIVIVYGVIKNSLNAFLSVALTEDNDSQES
jgi:hypothetical protein